MIPTRITRIYMSPPTRRHVPSTGPSAVASFPSSSAQSGFDNNGDPQPIRLDNAQVQLQSPLFGKIPPEIRNEIFRLVLQESIKPGRLYERDTYWRRPGFEGQKVVYTALLRACKRIYEETKAIPLRDLEPVFYLGRGREPDIGFTYPGEIGRWVVAPSYARRTKAWHWAAIKNIRVFAQLYALQPGLEAIFSSDMWWPINPTNITITIRYTDWFWWENNASIYPIDLDHFIPMNKIELPNSIKTVVVELENIVSKIRELDAVVGEMYAHRDFWAWKRRDGMRLEVKGRDKEDGVREWRWMGPTKFGKETYSHHPQVDTMEYVVKVLIWEVARRFD